MDMMLIVTIPNNNQNNTRASGLNSISYHDFGLHTEIDNNGKDYSGKGFQ